MIVMDPTCMQNSNYNAILSSAMKPLMEKFPEFNLQAMSYNTMIQLSGKNNKINQYFYLQKYEILKLKIVSVNVTEMQIT